MTKVAIIVLNWNQPQLSLTTISSLNKIKSKNFVSKIFLVDNGSTDNSVSIFKKSQKKYGYQLLISTTNLGFVGGNNFAIKHVLNHGYHYLLVCNNDITVKPNFLSQLLQPFVTNQKLAAVGPKIYFSPGREYHQHRYTPNQRGKVIWSAGGQIDWQNIFGSNIGIDQVDTGQFDQPTTNIDFLSGCCLLLKTAAVKKVGLFDPNYFMYLEDADLCLRLKQAGYKILYQPQAVIWHYNAGSSSSASSLHDYFLTRNRLLFGHKYAKLKTKLALHRQALISIFTSKSSWQKRGIIDFYLGRFGRGSWR